MGARMSQPTTMGTALMIGLVAAVLGTVGGVVAGATIMKDALDGPQGARGVAGTQGPAGAPGFSGMAHLLDGSDYLANGLNDLNCADIQETDFPTPPVDEDGLDSDADGVACET